MHRTEINHDLATVIRFDSVSMAFGDRVVPHPFTQYIARRISETAVTPGCEPRHANDTVAIPRPPTD